MPTEKESKKAAVDNFRVSFGSRYNGFMLTAKQKGVLDFVKIYQQKRGYSPSIPEIARHFKRAVGTVHEHLENLEQGSLLPKGRKMLRRGIEISKPERLVKIPLLGTIAAGQPIEAIENKETIAVPSNRIPTTGNLFALTVQGDSMVDENI